MLVFKNLCLLCECVRDCVCVQANLLCSSFIFFAFHNRLSTHEMLTGRVVVVMVVVVQVSQRGPAATVVFQVEGLVMGLGVARLPLPLAVSVGGGAKLSVLASPGLVLVFRVVFLVLLP